MAPPHVFGVTVWKLYDLKACLTALLVSSIVPCQSICTPHCLYRRHQYPSSWLGKKIVRLSIVNRNISIHLFSLREPLCASRQERRPETSTNKKATAISIPPPTHSTTVAKDKPHYRPSIQAHQCTSTSSPSPRQQSWRHPSLPFPKHAPRPVPSSSSARLLPLLLLLRFCTRHLRHKTRRVLPLRAVQRIPRHLGRQ